MTGIFLFFLKYFYLCEKQNRAVRESDAISYLTAL